MRSELVNAFNQVLKDASLNHNLLNYSIKEIRSKYPAVDFNCRTEADKQSVRRIWLKHRRKELRQQSQLPQLSSNTNNMLRIPQRALRRPPRPSRQVFQDEPADIQQNSEDLLQQVLARGYPSTLSVIQAIGMEEQYNFVNDRNQVAYYMMGFAGKGPGLASSSKRVGVYEKDAAQLKEYIHVLKGSAHDFIQQKKDEIKAAEEVLTIAEDLVKFHGEIEEVTRRGNAALSGEPSTAPTTLTGEPSTAPTLANFSANSPVLANGSFPAESPATNSFKINSVGSMHSNLLTPLSSPAPSFAGYSNNSSGIHIDPDSTPNPPSQKKRRFAF